MKPWNTKTTWAADVGGTSIKLALVEQERILLRREIPAQAGNGLLKALERMHAAWREMSRECGRTETDIDSVGMAFPGVIDPRTQKIWTTPAGKFDDSRSIDLRGWSRTNMGLDMTVCNDAKAALVGEWRYGAASGSQNACMMTLGTGVGTAVMMQGQLLHGGHGLAGNAGGHVTINLHGETCLCGNCGCVESEGSSWALEKLARSHPRLGESRLSQEPIVNYEAVFRLGAQGDPIATQLLHRSLEAWAVGAVNLVNSYDPDTLIIGGGVMKSADVILPFIQRYVRQRAWVQWDVPVVAARLGNDAGLLGVASLASPQSTSSPRPNL